MAEDLIDVVWSGPFHADGAAIGATIRVPRHQADLNPGWYRPVVAAKTPVARDADGES